MKFKTPIIILLHFLLFILVYLGLYKAGYITIFPTNTNILKWDAEWYLSIRSNGYMYLQDRMSNLAFFPLFPLFWKYIFLNSIGISVVNLGIFIFSLNVLLRYSPLPPLKVLLLVSIPSFIFFFLPYSEALFFLFGVLIIKGMEDKSRWLTCAGLLGCSLSRSVAVLFVPALLIMMVGELITAERKERRAVIIQTMIFAVCCITGVLLVALLQYENTGTWFTFLKVQQYWNRSQLVVPGIPFTTISPGRILQYDGLALLMGMLGIFFCMKYAWEKVKERSRKVMPDAVLFSILYMAGTALIDTLFTYKLDGQTNIWSLHRHLCCSPFFVWFLIWFWNSYKYRKWEPYIIGGIICMGIGISGVLKYPVSAAYFTGFAILMLMMKFFPLLGRLAILLYVINLVLQTRLFYEFILGDWVA